MSPKPDLSFRKELKVQLYNNRRIGIYSPQCPICDQMLSGTAEMHEVFISRGDVQKSPVFVRESIHSAANCVNVHPECHPQPGQEPYKLRCVQYLILFEGYSNILKWLQEINALLRSEQAGQEIRYLNNVMYDLMLH